MLRISLAFLAVRLLFPEVTTARTWHINPDGTGDAPTVQAGVDSASAGDTISLACGTYYDCTHTNWNGGRPACVILKSGLTLRSLHGDPSCATIDATSLGTPVVCTRLTDVNIEGLTLTHGKTGAYGGGFHAYNSSVTVTNCVLRENEAYSGGAASAYRPARFVGCRFIENSATYEGGALHWICQGPMVEDCVFEDNRANRGGALAAWSSNECLYEGRFVRCMFSRNVAIAEGGVGVVAQGGVFFGILQAATFLECRFDDNVAEGAGGALSGDRLTVESSVFRGNRANFGGAVSAKGPHPVTLSDCLIVENHAPWGGGVGASYGNLLLRRCTLAMNSGGGGVRVSDAVATLESTIVAFNTGGSAVYCVPPNASATATCSDLYGNEMGDWVGCLEAAIGVDGNFSGDPRFCDPVHEDFHLMTGSPCLPESSGACGLIGAFGHGCGAVSVDPASWGKLKAAYR